MSVQKMRYLGGQIVVRHGARLPFLRVQYGLEEVKIILRAASFPVGAVYCVFPMIVFSLGKINVFTQICLLNIFFFIFNHFTATDNNELAAF